MTSNAAVKQQYVSSLKTLITKIDWLREQGEVRNRMTRDVKRSLHFDAVAAAFIKEVSKSGGLLDAYLGFSEMREALVTDYSTGKVLFQQTVRVPKDYSYLATKVIAERWFRGNLEHEDREFCAFLFYARVTLAIVLSKAGLTRLVPKDMEKKEKIAELVSIIERAIRGQLNQDFVFNTPVYLNAGVSVDPQCSACFLSRIEDTYESLANFYTVEAKIFRAGGGSGSYVGNISHEGRKLSKGGYASGPLHFVEGHDRASGAIKSGGSHRRSARDVTMDCRHPDFYRNKEYLASLPVTANDTDFVREKSQFEKMRRDLAAAGHNVGLNSHVNYALPAQNANRAGLFYDEFLQAVKNGGEWDVRDPRSGETVWTYSAKEVWGAFCQASWDAADPTAKFAGNIEKFNLCPNIEVEVFDEATGESKGIMKFEDQKITQSNPCNEVIHTVPPVTDALIACNLSMQKLTNFIIKSDESISGLRFDKDRYEASVKLAYTLQDVIVDFSSYPTKTGRDWTLRNRILGCSISDMGGLLSTFGLAYDSEAGRAVASSIAAFHLAVCQKANVDIAAKNGACASARVDGEKHSNQSKIFRMFLERVQYCKDVSKKIEEILDLDKDLSQKDAHTLIDFESLSHTAAIMLDSYVLRKFNEHGLANMQSVSYAPQGTTGIITDCSTTSIEPMMSLKSYKEMIGGAVEVMVPESIRAFIDKSLRDYDFMPHIEWEEQLKPSLIEKISEAHPTLADVFIDELLKGNLNSALKERTKKVFETALGTAGPDGKPGFVIAPMGHVLMMADLQRFVCGAISKTCNVPNSTTPEEIGDIYMEAWKRGVKAISVYRDGCKGAQPVKLTTKGEDAALEDSASEEKGSIPTLPTVARKKMPDTVPTLRKKLKIGDFEFYLHIGLYEDGRVGEIFITGVQGTTLSGMMDSFATMTSYALQYGVPFDDLLMKLREVSFHPQGFVQGHGFVTSVPSLIVNTISQGIESGEFVKVAQAFYSKKNNEPLVETPETVTEDESQKQKSFMTSDPCPRCGKALMQTGTCKTCSSCGHSTGGCG